MKKILLLTSLCIALAIYASGNMSRPTQTSVPYGTRATDLVDQQQKKDVAVKTIYTCPMHPEITQDKAGKCPKCGMNLKAKEDTKDVYSCPMHSEIMQDKAGKCPKCGMNLVKKESVKKPAPGK